jgi:ferredoxin
MTHTKHTIHALYFSPTGTTKKIVQAAAFALTSDVFIHDLTLEKARQAESPSFKAHDLLIIGLPVYAGRIPLTIDPYLRNLKGQNTPVILIALYGNRDYDDALLEMQDILKSNGFMPISAGAFIGEHSYSKEVAGGRPDTKDIAIAKSFALSSYKSLQETDLKKLNILLPGHFPYKERHDRPAIGPLVSDSCILCNICVGHCPTGALTLIDKIEVDKHKCIQCCSCVKKCPQEAIEFTERIPDFKKFLIENYSSHKDPELFFAN